MCFHYCTSRHTTVYLNMLYKNLEISWRSSSIQRKHFFRRNISNLDVTFKSPCIKEGVLTSKELRFLPFISSGIISKYWNTTHLYRRSGISITRPMVGRSTTPTEAPRRRYHQCDVRNMHVQKRLPMTPNRRIATYSMSFLDRYRPWFFRELKMFSENMLVTGYGLWTVIFTM